METVGRPFGVSTMRARRMVGVGAMPVAAVPALVDGNTFAAMKDFDDARGAARIDLLPDQVMRDGIVEAANFNVIVEGDTGQAPLRELMINPVASPQHKRCEDVGIHRASRPARAAGAA